MNKLFRFILLFIILVGFSTAKRNDDGHELATVYKTGAMDPVKTLSNIGNISYWLYNDGKSGHAPNGDDGAIYPRGTAGVIYQDGLVWGAKVNGKVYVGGQAYRIGTQALSDHIYRIRRDWKKISGADVFEDVQQLYGLPVSSITTDILQSVIDQYKKDWKEWPVEQGAPYVDVNHNGIYDPVLDKQGTPDFYKGDYPGIKGASQVIWYKVNDQDSSRTNNMCGSGPMGIEEQVTVWAYGQPDNKTGQAIYKMYRLKNISQNTFNEMYLAQWADIDVGNYTDDLVGCDSLRSTAFAYNGEPQDTDYNKYHLSPPAVGYTLLQGPIVPSVGDTAVFNFQNFFDYKNLPMTSFSYIPYPHYEWGPEPYIVTYKDSLQWYNLLRGFQPTEDIDAPTPFTHRSSGKVTKFPLNGDPLTGIGDVDGSGANYKANDRKILLDTGPFSMKPGDEQEMVIALVGGLGTDRLNSIKVLKDNMRYCRELFESNRVIPNVSYKLKNVGDNHSTVYLSVDLSGEKGVQSCIAVHKSEYSDYSSNEFFLYDDGLHNDGDKGDGVWGDSLKLLNRKYPSYFDIKVIKNGKSTYYEKALTGIVLRQAPSIGDWNIIWEDGKQDRKINNDETVKINYGIRLKNILPEIDTLIFTLNDRNIFFPSLSPGMDIHDASYNLNLKAHGDTADVWYKMEFDHNRVIQSTAIPVIEWEKPDIWKDTLKVENIIGMGRWCFPRVADPSLIKGYDYSISFKFDSTDNLMYWNLKNISLDRIILKDQLLQNGPNHDFPIADGIIWNVYNVQPGIDAIVEVANGNGPLPKSEWDKKGAPFHGNNVWLSPSAKSDLNRFYVSASHGSITMAEAFSVIEADIRELGQHDVEIRFTEDSLASKLIWLWAGVNDYANVPLKAYDVGIGTYDDPSDDVRLLPGAISKGTKARFFDFDGSTDPLLGFPTTDWIILRRPVNDKGSYEKFDADISSGNYSYTWWAPNSVAILEDLTIADFDGGGTLPEPGTIIRFITKKPYNNGDSLIVKSNELVVNKQSYFLNYFQLGQNYPNPFNPSTHIDYQLPVASKVTLTIYNLLGQKVRTLINKNQLAGNYNVIFTASGLASGVYIYRLKAGKFIQSRKMLFLK